MQIEQREPLLVNYNKEKQRQSYVGFASVPKQTKKKSPFNARQDKFQQIRSYKPTFFGARRQSEPPLNS